MSDSSMQVVLERFFDAPIETLWLMWTNPDHFQQWYGPKGFTIDVLEMSLKVGGIQTVCMTSPDGSNKMYTTGKYEEIVPNKKLVYTDALCDPEGNIMSPEAMGMPPGMSMETLVTVVFEVVGDQTKITLTHSGVPESAKAGWTQAFDKIADYLLSL